MPNYTSDGGNWKLEPVQKVIVPQKEPEKEAIKIEDIKLEVTPKASVKAPTKPIFKINTKKKSKPTK